MSDDGLSLNVSKSSNKSIGGGGGNCGERKRNSSPVMIPHPKSPKTPPSPRTPPTPQNIIKPIMLNDEQKSNLSREVLIEYICDFESYVGVLESQSSNQEGEIHMLSNTINKLKHQNKDLCIKEKNLVRRLATKEQEIHDYASQLTELKSSQVGGSSMLRSVLLDPAVNVLIQRLKQELISTKTRLEETQNELNAWKFTPDSNTGKRLMAKCRLLQNENEELGKMISSGRLAKLEGDLALQKSFSEEVKKSQSELDEILQELDEDVEGMQTTIIYLQQELKKSKQTIINLEKQINNNQQHHNGNISIINGNSNKNENDEEEVEDNKIEDGERTRNKIINNYSDSVLNNNKNNYNNERTLNINKSNNNNEINNTINFKRTIDGGDQQITSSNNKRLRRNSDSIDEEFDVNHSDPDETLGAMTNGN